MLRLDSDQVLRSGILGELAWLRHGFGTRQASNWPGATATLKQIHSDAVFAVKGPGCSLAELGQGDALITAETAIPLSIRTADCVPLLLADPVRRVVAAVHAGWRGTHAGIVRKTVETMGKEYDSRPDDILAAIGPAIGPCCYEVSPDVAQRFEPYLPEWTGFGKTHLDLSSINRWQLLDAGLAPSHIDSEPAQCTRCHADLYHSFRRDAEFSGRMHAVIGIV